MNKIVIVDYGLGNIQSVYNAFLALGADVAVTDNACEIDSADKVVLPGVGAFDDTVKGLSEKGLDVAVKKAIEEGKPYLGICMGLQVLFSSSEEGKLSGLCVFKGKVKKFLVKGNCKVPHMGWNTVEFKDKENNPLASVIDKDAYFYFVHSYYVQTDDSFIIGAQTEYAGVKFVSMVKKDNIFAVQFHPEKSQKIGLKMLENFINLGEKC